MARAAAVVVKINATSRRLPAELQHGFTAVTEAVAVAFDRLASAKNQAEAAAVSGVADRGAQAARVTEGRTP